MTSLQMDQLFVITVTFGLPVIFFLGKFLRERLKEIRKINKQSEELKVQMRAQQLRERQISRAPTGREARGEFFNNVAPSFASFRSSNASSKPVTKETSKSEEVKMPEYRVLR